MTNEEMDMCLQWIMEHGTDWQPLNRIFPLWRTFPSVIRNRGWKDDFLMSTDGIKLLEARIIRGPLRSAAYRIAQEALEIIKNGNEIK